MTTDKHQVLASDRLRDANEHLTLTALEAQQRAEELAQRNEDQNKIVLKKRAILRELVSQLTVSEQRERKRLAAELHDYLAQMLRQFDRDLAPALAAYNAGPGNAARWRQRGTNDPDLYIESIDFSETRRYVPLVLEHYAQYVALYTDDDS